MLEELLDGILLILQYHFVDVFFLCTFEANLIECLKEERNRLRFCQLRHVLINWVSHVCHFVQWLV